MKRVLIPNRAEIALRIVRACRELGFESVVGASEPDRDGLAARDADRVVVLGPGPPSDSYLRDDAVIQAALEAGCDAIHPGYGFLSESPRLARRAREHGLTFVGPPTETIALAADKPSARAQARRAGVPVLPGGELTAPGVEGLVERAREIEVQIVADEHGEVVHLGERDCSVQRHRQTLVAEAPAPALPSGARGRLLEASVAVARGLGYTNVGTVAFVVDADTDDFFFLEVNCGIGVEHPVTEVVTGRDLVRLQLEIAAGDPLGFAQEDLEASGHAVQCQLNAEDVTKGLRLSPGELSIFAVPDRRRLRVDTHCFAGAKIPPDYDSLIAKLIAHGDDRAQAIDILFGGLEAVDVEGVETNRTLLAAILGHPDFRAGAVTTDWLQTAIRLAADD
jgi:acetyl-CoA carboxylase, biotin carboxylase subunit